MKGGLSGDEAESLIEAIEDYAIFKLGPTGEIRSWNRGAQRIMGYTADEVIGSHFSRFYTPVDLENQKPANELASAEAAGRVEDEGWRIRKDGSRFWTSTIITALREPDGTLGGFAKITRDLTDRRLADERLRQSEEMFRLLVDSVKEYAIFLLDPTGRVLTWNGGAHRIKGYFPEEIIGRHFSIFYSEADIESGKPAMELEVAEQTGSVEDEGWRLRKDGSRFWANVLITAVFDEKRNLRGFAKVTRDMTEKKRTEEMQEALFEQREARFLAEEERRRAENSYRVAQEANRAKDEFLMTLSHELRTPMTTILGWTSLLPSLRMEQETYDEAVNAISRSARLQARLIDDVLDVSRIVSGKLRLSVENIDVSELLMACVDIVRPTADAKVIAITTSVSPEIGTIIADPMRLQQIVWNLLSNAVKFTPKNGNVHLAARRTTSHLQVIVSDQGEGISPAFLPHVFEPFRQAESPSTRVHGGLGLGLSIVRFLAEAHGGSIVAESEGRGLGATFTLTLPVRAMATEKPEDRKTEVLSSHQELRRLLGGVKILVVDDDDEGRNLIQTVLRRAGAEVENANSAAKGLAALARMRPDLVLTDIAMPEMDGYALAREIRQLYPEQRIVALSAFPAGRSPANDAIFDAYLSKPITPVDLVERIANLQASER